MKLPTFGRSPAPAPAPIETRFLNQETHYGLPKSHETKILESDALVGSRTGSDSSHSTMTGKEICTSSRRGVLLNFLMFHLPSIAVSAVLFSFHIVGLCWATEPTADQLSALQFPAKAHEILIVMSLADILLHRIMYGLLGKAGLAMGFITAPLHVADPLYLFSPDFWGTVRKPVQHRRFHYNTIGLLVVLVLVGVTVGPLSATLMIPRRDFVATESSSTWYIDNVVVNPEIFYIDRNPYPDVLTANYASQAYGICLYYTTFELDVANEACAIFDINPFIQEVMALTEVSSGGARAQYNISMGRDGSWTPYRPLSTDMLSTAGMGTGSMDFVSYDLSRYSVLGAGNRDVLFRSNPNPKGSSKLEKWKQPLVAVSCATGLYYEDAGIFNFYWDDELLVHNMSMSTSEMAELYTLDIDAANETRTFSMPLQAEIPLPLSATILFSQHNATAMEEEGPENTHLEICHVVSRWHDADVWTDTRLPTGAQSELEIAPGKMFELFKKSDPDEEDLNMTGDWLRFIGPTQSEEEELLHRSNTDYAALLDASILGGGSVSWTLSKLLALYFTDAMTMSTPLLNVAVEDADSIEAGPDTVIIEISAVSHLYTYNFDNTRSRPIAFGLLFFHAALAIGHHLIILLSRKPWHSTGWGSVEELISLALRSKSPKDMRSMENIVTSSAARKLPIVIRGRDMDRGLEMVVLSTNANGDVEASGVDGTRGV